MNYRHAYHAGSFADVFKHIILIGIIDALKQKDKAFRIIDTHGGVGFYDLLGSEAKKTQEFQTGISCLQGKELRHPWITTYWSLIKSFNKSDVLQYYPGSPKFSQFLMRPQDTLQACELHPQDFALLKEAMGKDPSVQVYNRDGYGSLKAFLPPIERRGLVLIDPPFEDTAEFDKIFKTLENAFERFSTGVYAIWYPIKDSSQVEGFYRNLKKFSCEEKLIIEFHRARKLEATSMQACGMVILNPPYHFQTQLNGFTQELENIFSDQKDHTIQTYKI